MKSHTYIAAGLLLASVAIVGWEAGSGTVLAGGPSVGGPRADYFPKVTLRTHENKEVRFYEDLIRGKTVVIRFMYTKGDDCLAGTENLVQLQNLLGDRLGKDVFLYSITLDPDHDTPAVLRRYAESHGAKPGWVFLTGQAADIEALRRKLGVFDADAKADAERVQHAGMLRIGNDSTNRWAATVVMAPPQRIVQMIERLKPVQRK